MSFDKDYPNRKDRRKPYLKKGPKNSRGCRHGGSCSRCRENRLYQTIKEKAFQCGKMDTGLED